MIQGYILLHRKIKDSWIFQRSDYFHWFIILLLEANFKDKKNYLFNGKLITVKRGSFITSYANLVKLFPNSTIKKVRNFLRTLSETETIKIENLIKGTRITICNYDSYQDMGQPKGNQRATKGQPKGNNRKKEKERKERKYINLPLKKLTPKQFYEKELFDNQNEKLIEHYKIFVNFLFENETGEQLHSVLKMEQQLAFKNFPKIHQLKLENKKSIAEILLKMENDKKYTKGKKSLNLTLQNWLKQTFI